MLRYKMSQNNQKIAYWTMAILISAFFILSGYLEVTKNPATYPKTLSMGYPPYFISLLGFAKLIGAAVLLMPTLRLREWVFAAFTFDVVFAFFSGYSIQSYADCIKAVIVFIFLMVAYRLYQKTEKRSGQQRALVKASAI